MKYRVLVAASSRDDADDIFDWIALDSVTAAERWADGLGEVFRRLESFPNAGRIAPESKRARMVVRQTLYGNYRILYTVKGETVRVLHVRHCARRPMRRL